MATTTYGSPYVQSSDLVSGWPNASLNVANRIDDVAKNGNGINAQTGTTYTFVLLDTGKIVTASNAASSTYTVPPQSSVVWTTGTILRVTNLGAGAVTFAGGAGVTVTNTASTLAQYQSAALIRTASDAWTVVPFSGSPYQLKSTDVSSTTGSPTTTTYTCDGVGYTAYAFTGSGSITLARGGEALVACLAGGGGGGKETAGGGGAGELVTKRVTLVSGSNTVTVGAGGAGKTTSGGTGTKGTDSSIGTIITAEGGGGGGSSSTAGANGGSGGGGGRGTMAGGTAAGIDFTSGYAAGGLAGGTGGPGSGSDVASAGGGGGIGGAGANGASGKAGAGGAGTTIYIEGSARNVGGGGGGGSYGGTAGTGGTGAGSGTMNDTTGGNATANTGSGGGGGGLLTTGGSGGNGGSGIVVIQVRT